MIKNIGKSVSIALLSLIILTGCGRKPQSKPQIPSEMQRNDLALADMPVGLENDPQGNPLLVFDDDIEAFVLDDTQENPVKPEGLIMVQNQKLDFELEPVNAPTQERALVYFPYDSRQPLNNQQENMARIDETAKAIYNQGNVIAVKGHACKWHGTAAYNLAISQDRSYGIKNHLVDDLHIPESHIKVFGVGNEEPIAFEWSKEGQSPNRRVEVYGLAA